MIKRVKGLRSSAGGSFGALNEGEVRDLEAAIADDLIESGAAEPVAEEATTETEAVKETELAKELVKPLKKTARGK